MILAEENSHHGAEASHGEETTDATHHDVQTNAEAHAAMIHSTHDSDNHAEEAHGEVAMQRMPIMMMRMPNMYYTKCTTDPMPLYM